VAADEFLDEGVELDRLRGDLEFAGLDLGEVEEFVGEGDDALGALDDGAGELLLLGVEAGLKEEVGHAQHAVHGNADIVAKGCDEIGGHARGMEGGVAFAGDDGLLVFLEGDVGGEGEHAAVGERGEAPADPEFAELEVAIVVALVGAGALADVLQ
jgi:hypothetical protein